MTFIVRAPAKINLHLRILGLRPDGYHEVLTLLQSLHLHDTLTFRPRPGPLTIHCRSPHVPTGRANLVWEAASVLWEALGRRGEPAGASVAIRKRVPAAAGLAGGSSDAAAALRGLCAAWDVPSDADWLHGLASKIGSDVPYFLDGGAAVARGRGERISHEPDIEPLWVVLARPPFGVATADAYRWFDAEQPRRTVEERPAGLPPRWRQTWQGLRNELQPVVARRHPEVAVMVERLARTGALAAAMTGSGSVVYGLYRREPAAAAARLAVRRRGWRTLLTRTTGRTDYTRLVAAVPLRPG